MTTTVGTPTTLQTSTTIRIDPRGPRFGAAVTSVVLSAALLNAVFDFCLGCELYLLNHPRLGVTR